MKEISSLVEENSIEINAYLTPLNIHPLSTRAVTKLWVVFKDVDEGYAQGKAHEEG